MFGRGCADFRFPHHPQRAKNEKLHQLRTAHFVGNPELTFRPAVNPGPGPHTPTHSVGSHAAGSRDGTSVGASAQAAAAERLSKDAEDAARRHVQRCVGATAPPPPIPTPTPTR